MNILVISGGISSERKISLISAGEVKKALKKYGHAIQLFDLKLGLKALEKLIPSFDLIFPVLHGEEGEGGNLQKFLQQQQVPFVDGDFKGFKQGWYKIPFKKFCDQNRITTAPWKKVGKAEDVIKFGFPCVLKASSGGSSREVIILKSPQQLNLTSCKKLFQGKDALMVEKYLPGVEVTVGILNNQALPVIEIIPPEGKWFDYKNKYAGTTKEVPFAPSVDPKIQQQIQKTALNIHRKLNLGSYSRIDFIVSDSYFHLEGVKLTPYVLEVNTIPGFTPNSLFPKAAKAAGLNFEQLVEKLVTLSFIK